MVAVNVETGVPEAVAAAKAVLLKTFGAMGGVTARAEDLSRVLPLCPLEAVLEALEALAEEGSVEVASLSDGVAVYQFVRH
jgi:hypothetical protein